MPDFPVTSTKKKVLFRKMQELGIREEDFEEKFIRSSRPGGQNVNKVSTCVVLRHRPTGIEVRCQKERSQALNRFLARRLLVERIERRLKGIQSEERHRIEKIRRQKRRRSRRAKEKMLSSKKHRSQIKRNRSVVRESGEF